MFHVSKKYKNLRTNVNFLGPRWRYLVINILVAIKIKAAEGVEDEISKVFIHVDSQDPAVKAVYGSPTIHHLRKKNNKNV